MPGLDRSGPMGAGPMTGGRRGLCAGGTASRYDIPVYGGLGYGRGFGLGRGFRGGFGAGRGIASGFGRRFFGRPIAYGFNDSLNKRDELEMLKADADAMRKSLTAIQKRMEELEQEESD